MSRLSKAERCFIAGHVRKWECVGWSWDDIELIPGNITRLLDDLDDAEAEIERLLAMLAPFLGSDIPLVGEE